MFDFDAYKDQDMERMMQAKKREILKELQDTKDRLLSELLIMNRTVAGNLASIADDYNRISAKLSKIGELEENSKETAEQVSDQQAELTKAITEAQQFILESQAKIEEEIAKGMENIEIPEGFSGSWNDLSHKPFYEVSPIDISWEGHEGKTPVATVEGEVTSLYYLLKEGVIPESVFYDIKLYYPNDDEGEELSVFEYGDVPTIFGGGRLNYQQWIYLYDGKTEIAGTGVIPSAGIYLSIRPYDNATYRLYHPGVLEQLDEKFIPNSVKLQADWNQSDETAPDFVKNRTHYEAPEIMYTVDFEGIEHYIGAVWDVPEIPTEFKNYYKTKAIKFDGVLYSNLEGVNINGGSDEDDVVDWYIGNPSLFDSSLSDSGLPFCLYRRNIMFGNLFFVTNTEGDHTVTFYGETTVHQLDEKFIPGTIARVEDVEQMIADAIANISTT